MTAIHDTPTEVTDSRWRGNPGRATLAAIAAGALAFDLAVQHPFGLTTFVAATITAIAVLWSSRADTSLTTRVLLAGSLLPAAMLIVRDSPWLTWLNLMACAGLILLAAVVRDEPRPVGHALGRILRPLSLLDPAVRGAELIAVATGEVAPRGDGLGDRVRRIARSATLAAPVTLVLLGLLASADAVFASFLDVPFGATGTGEHASIVALGVALTTAVVAHRSWADPDPAPSVRRRLGATDVAFTLGAVLFVYGGFVASQVVALAAGDGYVRRTTGLTYAEYARTGFFQLLTAALITLVILLGLVRLTRPTSAAARRRLVYLAEGVVGLTLLVVMIAVRRLFLYEAEFGLTMLRLTTIVFAVWIGIVFVAVGLHIAGRLDHELAIVVVASALGVLLAVGAANPESVVARRNIDRFGGSAALDVDYLVDRLGADAIPTILTDPSAASALCARRPRIDDHPVTFNHGRHRAAEALRERCTSVV